MRFVPRHLAPHLDVFLAEFPALILLGARQVGKSTLLEHHLRGWTRIDLEDAATHDLVARDPALYLRDHPDRIWFDESQRCPELFPALRVAIDRDRRPGRYVLSGSTSPDLARHGSESLAGRAGVLVLEPLTVAECGRRAPSRFVESLWQAEDAADFLDRVRAGDASTEPEALQSWLAGGFPEARLAEEPGRAGRWFEAYVRLVSERDLGEVHRDLRPVAVRRLLAMLAARHGGIVNIDELARGFGVNTRAMGAWLDALEGSGLWRRLPPWSVNTGKRLVKRPKGYLADSGLLHALAGLTTLDELRGHPLLGPSFEGFVLAEIRAALALVDVPPSCFFWSTHGGAEVDVVLERGGRVRAVEAKHASKLDLRDLRGLSSFLTDHGDACPFGVVVHRGERPARLSERIVGVPLTTLCGLGSASSHRA